MRHSALLVPSLVLAGIPGCGGGQASTTPPATLDVQGVLTPAAGLSPSDFDVWGPAASTATASKAEGGYAAAVKGAQSGFVFAGPRAGTPSALRVATAGGLYMTPAMGSWSIVGPPYHVAEGGMAALDASSTVISLILLHPELGHPSASVMRQQADWLVSKLSAGWPELAAAATQYDVDLAAGVDPWADPLFTTSLFAAFATVEAAMPAFVPDEPRAAKEVRAEDLVHMAKGGNVVSTLVVDKVSEVSASFKPGTVTGTGLDFLWEVRALDAADFPGWTADYNFTNPQTIVARAQAVMASGFAPSSSYFSYLDIVGNALRLATATLSWLPDTKSTFEVPAVKRVYEVRFFSGALAGASPAELAFTDASYPRDARAALIHNIAGGFIEALSLIPGAEAVLGDEVGKQVVLEAFQTLILELESMMSAKGSAITASDVYTLVHNTTKAAVDKFIDQSTQKAQAAGWAKFLNWAKWGGEKAVKVVMSVPGKVAKGGALANRVARLFSPDSLMEVWLIAVEDGGGPAVTGSYAWTHGSPTNPPVIDVTATWTATCQSIEDELTLTNKQEFTSLLSCPAGKAVALSFDSTAVFADTGWRTTLGNGGYDITRGKTLQLIVPAMDQQYGSLSFLTQSGGAFPVTVSAAGATGLNASFTFTGANQSVFLGPAYSVSYEVEHHTADNAISSTDPRQYYLQLGSFNFQSR